MPDITFIKWESGNWLQMYVNRKLVYEGHSIDDTMVLDEAGIPYTCVTINGYSDEAEYLGHSGKNLDDALKLVKNVIIR